MSENSKECLSSLSCMSIVFMQLLAKLNDWILILTGELNPSLNLLFCCFLSRCLKMKEMFLYCQVKIGVIQITYSLPLHQ